jgi:hypothetical protein
MEHTLESKQFCMALKFTHMSGDVLYPSAKRDRRTGQICWTVAKPGTGNNTKEHEVAVFDEPTLIDYVAARGYSVRCRSTDGKRTGLYNPAGRSVRFETQTPR